MTTTNLPARVQRVTVYGNFACRTLSVREALDFIRRPENKVTLILGAMQPGYLGREKLDEDILMGWVVEQERWDERRKCHTCGHWRTEYVNVDGFHYCNEHYPEQYR
jgi:hypothetical protein